MTWRFLLVGCVLLVGACSSRSGGDGNDGGTVVRDAGRSDSGVMNDDAGAEDAGQDAQDAALVDAGQTDAGDLGDAGEGDAAVGVDAGESCVAGGCGEEAFCNLGLSCGGPGVCQPRPGICTGDCPGVCGCDGRTYCNECGANAMGISVDATGTACETDPCEPMLAGGEGACLLVLGTVWDGTQCRDVSGCSCVGEDCSRLFETFEECETAYAACLGGGGGGGECGGRTGATCGITEWCDQTHCGRIDEAGICRDRPRACPEILDPVCGCDGRTYDNACLANSHGVDVSTPGACEE